jgi:hypothetical protein
VEESPEDGERLRGVSPAAAPAPETILFQELRADRPGRCSGSGAVSHGRLAADTQPSPAKRAGVARLRDPRSGLVGGGYPRASGSTIPGRLPGLPRRRERSRALEPPRWGERREVRRVPQASMGALPLVSRSPEPKQGTRAEPAVGHTPRTEGQALSPAAFAVAEPAVLPVIPRAQVAAAARTTAAAWGASSVDPEEESSDTGPGQLRTSRIVRSPRSPAYCIGDRRSPFVAFLSSNAEHRPPISARTARGWVELQKPMH